MTLVFEENVRMIQDKILEDYLSTIREKLSSQTTKAVITCKELDMGMMHVISENPTILKDLSYKEEEHGFGMLVASSEFFDKIKDSIPTTIKELTIPMGCIPDLTYLSTLPNLETLTISDYSYFTEEELEYILNNTSVRNINIRSSHTFDILKYKKGSVVLDASYMIATYKGITFRHKPTYSRSKDHIYIYMNEAAYSDLTQLEETYDEIKDYLPRPATVTFYDSLDKLESRVYMELGPQSIKELNIRQLSPRLASYIFGVVSSYTSVDKTKVHLYNKTYEDIYYLRQAAKKSTLEVICDDTNDHTNLDDFIGMRATIDYYKTLMEEYNLSPAEKVMFVYDLLKTWRYKEFEEDRNIPRKISTIISTGNIVCVGYSTFATKLLQESGIKATEVNVTCINEDGTKGEHQRNFVRIDDEKYNIHGLFALDITWDNDKEVAVIEKDDKKSIIQRPGEQEQPYVVDYYGSLAPYRYFLIPMSDYEVRYPNENNPMIYEKYKNKEARTLVKNARDHRDKNTSLSYTTKQHLQLFSPEEGAHTVERYFNASKPSLETFEEILHTVRQAQGYTPEEASRDVKRVVELHNMLNEQNTQSPNTFFKPTK